VAIFCDLAQNGEDFEQMAKTQLTMTVLTVGGDHYLGEPLGAQIKLVAKDVSVVLIQNSGHWVLEEQPKQTTDALLKLL
jgi:pimeloyl-ACP methyl ester carboxylesterase